MTKKASKNEGMAKAVGFCLFIASLIYVGYLREILKGHISDVHRTILCILLIYGLFRLSNDFALFVVRRLRIYP